MGPYTNRKHGTEQQCGAIYALRINRVVPLRIPLVSDVLGPIRYEGLFGSLKGHRYPNAPWIHAEKFSFKPTRDLEFGFSRVVIFAGEDTEPLTFGTFWRSFTSFSNVTLAEKESRNDPGFRSSSFDFTWRLPWMEKWLTLYSDSMVHDDVAPWPLRVALHSIPVSTCRIFPGSRTSICAPRLYRRTRLDPIREANSSTTNLYIRTAIPIKATCLGLGWAAKAKEARRG